MSLEKTIEELKEQIEEAKKDENEIEDALDAEEIDEEKGAEVLEEKAEEKVEEKAEEKIDDSGYARLRREAAASKKKAEAESEKAAQRSEEVESLKAELAALKGESAPQDKLSPILNDIVNDHQIKQMERGFRTIEDQFKSRTPDYEAVSSEYAQALAQSIRIQNPRMSATQIAEQTKFAILNKAENFAQRGLDPAEELYHEARDLGFSGKKQEEKKEAKPDMAKLAANRARNAGTAAASGKSEGSLTKAAAAEMPNSEWMKLTAEEKSRLMYS